MLSSAIPARLEFQCGHSALVSLPRVTGESSAQRNNRILREKASAQVRSCDFCPTRLELVPHTLAPVEPQPAPLQVVTPIAVPVAFVKPVAVQVAPATPVAPVVSVSESVIRTPRPRRAAATRPPENAHPISYQFVVRFRTEAILQATDIRDAIRQTERLGASEVLAVTRQS